MNTRTFSLTLVLLFAAFIATACGTPASAAELPITDVAGLVAGLEAAGATVERSDPISQPFFEPAGQVLKVNGLDLQVFEYADEAAAERDASAVSPDGSSTGTTMITWMDAPHFYRSGKLIVLYVGSDAETIQLLEGLLGAQFAGR